MEGEASVRMKGGLRHVDDADSPRQQGWVACCYCSCTCTFTCALIRDSNSN